MKIEKRKWRLKWNMKFENENNERNEKHQIETRVLIKKRNLKIKKLKEMKIEIRK